jgi:hypothetical protein
MILDGAVIKEDLSPSRRTSNCCPRGLGLSTAAAHSGRAASAVTSQMGKQALGGMKQFQEQEESEVLSRQS